MVQILDTEKINYSNVPRLVENISALYLNQQFSDISFKIKGEKLFAHKVILAIRSDFFKTLLYGDEQNSCQSEIRLNDASVEAFRVLLKFVYTGHLKMNVSNVELVVEVLVLARQYVFKNVEIAIVQRLKTVVNAKNVCLIFDIANQLNLVELWQVCRSFMDLHESEIVNDNCFKPEVPSE